MIYTKENKHPKFVDIGMLAYEVIADLKVSESDSVCEFERDRDSYEVRV